MTSGRETPKPHGASLFDPATPDVLTASETRADASATRLLTALCVLAASPATIAVAQENNQAAEPADLPPLVVETTKQKKKAAVAKKKSVAPTSPAPQPAPVQEQAVERPQTPPLPGQAGAPAPGQYNAQYSTSNKVTGPLLDTPQTVSVIPGTIIQERKATTLVEALRNTPGITFDAGENAFGAGGNQFNLRGFNSVSSIFIDGTRDNGSYTRDVYNIDSIEVFKGPAADNGRGTAGGYINMHTKTPQIGNFVAGDVGIGFDEYDSEMRRRASLDVNQTVGTVGVRLNSVIQDGGVAGRDVAEANAWGVAPSLAFGLGTDVRAIFAYEHFERNDLPDAGVAINRRNDGPGGPSVGIPGAGPRPDGGGNVPRDFFFGSRNVFDDVESDAFLARFEYDVAPGITISNQTRWAEIGRQATISNHVGGPPPSTALFSYDRNNESIYNQTNLAARFYTGPIRHTVSTGVEFSREESFANRNLGQTASVEVDTAAFYLYDTMRLSRQWELVGGIRVENYDLDLAGDGIPGGAYSDNETTVGGKAGIVYKPVENASVYASYGLSHLPHGSLLSNPDIFRQDANAFPGFVAGADPVEFHNFEIGGKLDFFNGRLSTTAALFRTEKHKAAIVGRQPGETSDSLQGYGEQVVQGLELGIAGELTEQWKIYGGLVVMDSERQHSAALDAARRIGQSGSGDYGCTVPAAACTVRTSGDELAFTPNFSANIWTTYDVTDDFTIGGGVQYVGESYIGRPDDANRIIKNGRYGKLPDYFLVNLYASYDITDNIELALNVDNVFDETYLTTINWGGGWGYLGAPRTYWLSANFKY